MAHKAKGKTEMKGTGGGRWTTRAEAKAGSKKARRASDRKAEQVDNERAHEAPGEDHE